MKNYYDILGITRQATNEEIRSAFRALAQSHHPDHNADTDAHNQFIEIKEAYETLINPFRRKRYDAQYFKEAQPGNYTAAHYELVKQKRAGRYRRGMYERRVVYKGGSAYSPQTTSTQNQETPKPEYVRLKYKQKLDLEQARIGFGYLAMGIKAISVLIFLGCFYLSLDLGLSRNIPKQEVRYVQKKKWTYKDPGTTQIQTESYSFKVYYNYGAWIRPGDSIRMQVTPFRKLVTKVYIQEYRRGYWISTLHEMRSLPFLFVVLMLISTPFVIFGKLPQEAIAFVGTVLILISVIISGILFSS